MSFRCTAPRISVALGHQQAACRPTARWHRPGPPAPAAGSCPVSRITASIAPLRKLRPSSRSSPESRVCAVKATASAPFGIAGTDPSTSRALSTMDLPSGVSSASEASAAASASRAMSTPGAGISASAIRLPKVMVPVLSSKQRVHVARRLDRAARFGDDIGLHQPVHPGDADGTTAARRWWWGSASRTARPARSPGSWCRNSWRRRAA